MTLTLLVLWAAFGASVGSFLNLCVERLPSGKSILWPGSHCEACGRGLSPLDLVPILSYLALRGRCRTCGSIIPAQALLVEVITAVAFVMVFRQANDQMAALVAVTHASFLIVVALIDLKHHLILNRVTYPWAIISLAFAFLRPQSELTASLTGAALALAIFLLIYVFSRGGMGFGDVKLAAVIGLVLGLPVVIVAILFAAVSGGITATLLLLTRQKRREDPLPFGVFLASGAMIALLWGDTLWQGYLQLVTFTK